MKLEQIARPTVERLRLRAIYEERIDSLLADGYKVRHRTITTTLWFVRLHHMSNGNDIVVMAYPDEGRVIQKTNHIVVYDDTP